MKRRHAKKLEALLHMKTVAEKLESNPNEVIINLSGQELTSEQVEVLKLGIATRTSNKTKQFGNDGGIRRPV